MRAPVLLFLLGAWLLLFAQNVVSQRHVKEKGRVMGIVQMVAETGLITGSSLIINWAGALG